MKKLFLLGFAFLPSAALAQYASPIGYELIGNIPGQPLQDAGAMPDANWNIVVSGAPGPLVPFVPDLNGYISSNKAVVVQIDGKSVWVGQYGTGVACTVASGAPSEFDVDVSPSASAKPSVEPNLASIASLAMSGDIIIEGSGSTPGVKPCKVNKTSATIGAIFIDTKTNPQEKLFYSVNLFSSLGDSTKPGGWYWTGNHVAGKINEYGYSDVPASFNDVAPQISDHSTLLSFDLASRIDTIIESGQTNIDKNLSDWTLEGVNYGQAHWGNSYLVTGWSGFVPVVITK